MADDFQGAVDNLKIVVTGSSQGVETSIKGITAAIRGLREAVSGNVSKQLGKATDALKTMVRNLSAIDEADVAKIERLADALSKLSAIGKVKTGISVSGKGEVKKVVGELDGGTSEGAPAKAGETVSSKSDKSASKFSDLFAKLRKSLLRVAFYRAIRTLISGITNSISKGMSNAYEYSKSVNGEWAKAKDNIAASTTYLQNAIGAAAAELVTTFQPAITFVCDRLADAANLIAQMNAYLRGSSTYMKAVKKDAESATRSLLGFDEINKLNGTSAYDSFETVEVSQGEALGTLTVVTLIGAAIAAWTAAQFISELGEIISLLETIGGMKVMTAITGGTSATGGVAGVLGTIGGLAEIVTAIGAVATSVGILFNKDAYGKSTIEYLWDDFTRVLGDISDMCLAIINSLTFADKAAEEIYNFLHKDDEKVAPLYDSNNGGVEAPWLPGATSAPYAQNIDPLGILADKGITINVGGENIASVTSEEIKKSAQRGVGNGAVFVK